MNMLEQQFMQQVPSLLKDMSKSLKAIASGSQAAVPEGHVWVFTAEQTCDYVTEDVIVRVFSTEEKARLHLHDFIHKVDDSVSTVVDDCVPIADYVALHNWDVEYDDPDHFRAYPEGSYPEDHIECMITRCEVG